MSRSTTLILALVGSVVCLLSGVSLLAQTQGEMAVLVRGAVHLETKSGKSLPASQVKVRLVAPGARRAVLAETYTDPRGIYYFEEVPAGVYRLEVLANAEMGSVPFAVQITSGKLTDVSPVIVPYSTRVTPRRYERAGLNPGALLEDPATGRILVISKPVSRAYLLDREDRTFWELGSLQLNGRATDHCLVTTAGGRWIVSLSRTLSGGGMSVTYITVTPWLEGGRSLGASKVRKLYFRAFSTVLFRPKTQQIVLLDREQAGIYGVDFLDDGSLGSLDPVALPAGLNRPTSAAFSAETMFIGDSQKRRVMQVEGKQTVNLPAEVHIPIALTTAPQGDQVAVIDALDRTVIRWRRLEGEWQLVEGTVPRELRDPTVALLLRDGTLLVGDASGAVVELL